MEEEKPGTVLQGKKVGRSLWHMLKTQEALSKKVTTGQHNSFNTDMQVALWYVMKDRYFYYEL